ncbi:dUTP diphosphatase [Paenibacillus ihumii]|uniref:dUTP diphosphatase n=1 Tax=Paenibacillus ihumii TaxID=687436 RepID=UPI0006D8419E|nr:dUTP diphosphatase [Paenibacillus ihumii]
MALTIEQMYEMQKQLDAKIIKEKGLEGQDLLPNTVLALQVEIAELANEWRGFKHWSNDREPRREKMLEEYVDCLHFFLSIAVQKGWLEHLYLYEEAIEEARDNGLDGGIGGAILEVIYWLSKLYMEKEELPNIKEKLGYSTEVFYFRNAWFVFMAVGMIGFEFTWEQIAAAYVAKNAVNHERQANGY